MNIFHQQNLLEDYMTKSSGRSSGKHSSRSAGDRERRGVSKRRSVDDSVRPSTSRGAGSHHDERSSPVLHSREVASSSNPRKKRGDTRRKGSSGSRRHRHHDGSGRGKGSVGMVSTRSAPHSNYRHHEEEVSTWKLEVDISSIVSVHKNVQKIAVSPFDTIQHVKTKLHHKLGYEIDAQQLFSGRIPLKNSLRIFELDNGGGAFEGDETIPPSLPMLRFHVKSDVTSGMTYGRVSFKGQPPKSRRLVDAMRKSQIGFARKFKPGTTLDRYEYF